MMSSKYSNENFEGRRGEGFHVNSCWQRMRNRLRMGVGCLGKRCRVCLIVCCYEIRLPGDRVNQRVTHLVFRGARCAPKGP